MNRFESISSHARACGGNLLATVINLGQKGFTLSPKYRLTGDCTVQHIPPRPGKISGKRTAYSEAAPPSTFDQIHRELETGRQRDTIPLFDRLKKCRLTASFVGKVKAPAHTHGTPFMDEQYCYGVRYRKDFMTAESPRGIATIIHSPKSLFTPPEDSRHA